ncbi:MAG: hypothetical protein HY323_09210 [Betaproteobacteria bacterium]|nr:hypothetical protein [Betaproteobacteria bacterium]
MADNLTRGAVQIITNDPLEINHALMRLREELDEIQGLRGRAKIFDRARVDNPVEDQDALTKGSANLGTFVTLGTGQTITGAKTFQQPIRITDSNGDLVHALGTIV